MLTIFTTPKPFRDHIGIIQTNAIRSWLQLHPGIEAILFGDEEGIAETASRLGIRHVAQVERNEYGTPLLNSIFSTAQGIARYPLMCYINTDIILMSDFMTAIGQVQLPSFLITGRRWDLDLEKLLDFSLPDWEGQLRAHLAKAGRLHGASGLDYFIFSRGVFRDIPPFAIGRGGWDNWLIYRARSLKIPVIDATKTVTAIHQNHDYSHLPAGGTLSWKGPERLWNRQFTRQGEYAFTLKHATRILTPEGMKRASSRAHLYFRLRAIPVLYPNLHFLLNLFKIFERVIIPIRSIQRRSPGSE